MLEVAEWIKLFRPAMRVDVKKGDLDVINLGHGRDFLTESKRYRIVILFSIMHHNRIATGLNVPLSELANEIPVRKDDDKAHEWETHLSPLHSIEQWRKRLLATQAELIFAVRIIACSLEAWHIGELDGYKRTFYKPNVGVYVRRTRVRIAGDTF